MKFKLYARPHTTLVIRIYAKVFDGVGISRSSSSNPLSVTKGKKGGTEEQATEVNSFLLSKGIDLNSIYSLEDLCEILEKKGLVQGSRAPGRKSKKNINDLIDNVDLSESCSTSDNSFIPAYRKLSPSELSQATNNFKIKNTQILKKTLNNLVFEVDHREPSDIADTLRLAGANVQIGELAERADFRVTMLNDDSREMIFERKVITDLGSSIISDDAHAHDQAERYSIYREKRQNEGCHVGVYWITENQNNGKMSLYNALELTQMMDGWLNYIQSINEQQHIQSLNTYHTACLIFKHAQGFFERELRKPVTIGLKKKRIDRTKDQRQNIVHQKNVDHGVTRPSQGVSGMLAALPGISSKVAKSLASTGKNMPQIMLMSLDEMILLDGIGKITATHMINLFTCTDS
jgi:ERCC4-type nuclease